MNQASIDVLSSLDRAPLSDTPCGRLAQNGGHSLSDTELLAIILQGNGIASGQAVRIASRIMISAGSLQRLLSWTPINAPNKK